jgi:hypothetical protein
MPTVNIWGVVGNSAAALPMVRLVPVVPASQGYMLAWSTVDQGIDYAPVSFDFTSLNTTFVGNVSLATSKVYQINGTQVVSARRTGWTPPTGTATRTAFDPATVTLSQLAERMKALLDDLTAHGLIGA